MYYRKVGSVWYSHVGILFPESNQRSDDIFSRRVNSCKKESNLIYRVLTWYFFHPKQGFEVPLRFYTSFVFELAREQTPPVKAVFHIAQIIIIMLTIIFNMHVPSNRVTCSHRISVVTWLYFVICFEIAMEKSCFRRNRAWITAGLLYQVSLEY